MGPESKNQRAKLLGQHFLASSDVLARIIAAAGLMPDDTVLEIGPGNGSLTRALAKKAGAVVAVEKDRELADALVASLKREGIKNAAVTSGDILKIRLGDLGLPKRYIVAANIPYYLTSRLIRKLLEMENPPQRILLMVQKEVAERITAKPPKMNLLALAVQTYGTPRVLFGVPAYSFRPIPKVDSAFITIRDIGNNFFAKNNISAEAFFRVAGAGFRGKRKTIENSLALNLNLPKTALSKTLSELGLLGKRPDTLTPDDWVRLARALSREKE